LSDGTKEGDESQDNSILKNLKSKNLKLEVSSLFSLPYTINLKPYTLNLSFIPPSLTSEDMPHILRQAERVLIKL